jgi:hypothetical protein
MHPDKFMRRAPAQVAAMSPAEREERLTQLGVLIAGRRKEAVEARQVSGIETVWMEREEAYLGIDDANRHEFTNAKWAKPTSMSGPLTSSKMVQDTSRSNAFVLLTMRYVDAAAAKLSEILLPIDDKAFSFTATPDPTMAVQTQAAQSMQAVAAQVTTTATQPPADQADAAAQAAERAENRVYDWWIESKYPSEARKVIADAARLGVGVMKGPFPDSQKSKAITRAPSGVAIQMSRKVVPALKWVDPWNLFPDESCGEDVHDGEYILERDFLSSRMLKKLKEQDGYLGDQIDKVVEEGPGKVYAEGGNPNEKSSKNKRFEIWYYYGTIKRNDMRLASAPGIDDLPEDQDEVYAIVSLVNDTVIRAVINPLDSGSFPYRVVSWSRRSGHWAGVGPGEQVAMPQRLVNAATRALLNNAGLSAGPQIVIDQQGIVPANKDWKLTPNKIWYKTGDSIADDVRKAFFSAVIPSVQKEMMAVIEYGMKLAEESSGIPLVTQGRDGPTTPQTFGQAELQDNNAHTWLRHVAARYDDAITEPLVTDFYEWLLLDPSVPDDEKGDFQINAHGSVAMVERVIQEQTYDVLLQAAANPAFQLDPAKLMAEKLKAKRLDPRKIQYSKEEQEQRAKQPPPPPPQVQVAQINAAAKLHDRDMQNQAQMQEIQVEAQHEQGLLQSGGATPHMAAATARIESERIRAATAQTVEASRAHAENARADKELQIATQNGQFEIEKLRLQKELALLDYANKNQISLDKVKAELAQSAMDNATKRELASAELQLAQTEGDKDRAVDLHKHHNPVPSLVRDEVSTAVTP